MRPPLWFRALVRLYPRSFRDDYSGEMWSVHRQGDGSALALIGDTLVNATRVHADVLRQDVAFALRTLRRSPGFTATVLAVAALGIGANTAAFSLTDHVLLRPLPYAEPDRLVSVWRNDVRRGYSRFELSPAVFRDFQSLNRSFEGLAAYTPASANLVGLGPPERLEGATVSAELLPILGVQPVLGRAFAPADDRDGAPGTVILSWGFWHAAFAGDPSVVGKSVTLDGQAHTVIGVMPAGFTFPGRETQFWQPFRFDAELYSERDNTYLRVVGRLAPGISPAQARADLDVISETLGRVYGASEVGLRTTVDPLRAMGVGPQARTLVLALAGAAVCVLLITCLNLASLLLTRALARRRELTLRTALGAGRDRLVRQLVTESLLLALGGGVLGVLLAAAALPLLASLVPAGLPIGARPELDLRVLGAAAAATVVAALAFGVLPALRASRDVDPETLREGAHAAVGGRRTRLRRALVIGEVAASLALLAASGLLLRALLRVEDRDPGFRAEGVLTLRTWLPWPRYEKTADRARFYDQVLEKARALPGVSGAAYTSFVPMAMPGGIWSVAVSGRPQPESERPQVSLRFVTPGYFPTLSIPIRAGREVSAADTFEAPRVAVVSESFAREIWPGESALGKRFVVAFVERTVVGVVGDVRVRGLERESEPQVYLPYRQIDDGWMPFYPPKDLVVRATVPPATLVPALRAIVSAADPEQPVSSVRLLEDVVSDQTAPRRVQLHVVGSFAALAFLLAALGIHGLLAFSVSGRSQEIGVRMALGATPRGILWMVLREGLWLAAAGAGVGLALAYAAGKSLGAVLAGVPVSDVVTLAAALALALAMTLLGSAAPAWRAARVDPARVMRSE
jgi:putative ABC transport system permease protein